MTKPAKSRKQRKWIYWALLGEGGKIRRMETTKEKADAWINTYVGQTDLTEIIPVTITEGHGRMMKIVRKP